MNRNAVKWVVGAVAVLSLAPISVIFGMTLLPSRIGAQQRGTLVPWLLTWGLISLTALIAVALAGFLTVIGVSDGRRSQ
jgi:hypothetical protein